VAYYPTSNGLVEGTYCKILEILRHVITQMHEAWEGWIPQVATSINGSINIFTGESPFYIQYGVDQRLPYDILTGKPVPVYNMDDYAKKQINVLTKIHGEVRKRLAASHAEMIYCTSSINIPLLYP